MRKKQITKLVTFLMAFVLCLVLVACGDVWHELKTESGVTANGEFEKGSSLEVKAEAATGEKGKAALAVVTKPYDVSKVAVFDISVVKDGVKVQPNGKVKVTLPKPFASEHGFVTYHVKNDNSVEELVTTVSGDNVTFETESFSYFIVAAVVNANAQHVHSYVERAGERNLVDTATCQRKAVYRLICSICNAMGRETFEYGDLAAHNLREEKGYDAGCERAGLTHGKRCITPGCTYTEQEVIRPHGHSMQAENAKAPTCTEAGWNAHTKCKYCGKTEGYVQIPATGHKMQVVPRLEPTCTKWGYEEHEECTVEGCKAQSDYKSLPALGHDEILYPAKEPTCTEEGYWRAYRTCSRCDYTSNTPNNTRDALGHFLQHHEAKAPDCLVGWAEYNTCRRDGCDYTTKVEIPATGKHNYVCDVCTTCGEQNPIRYTREGNYIYFGYWTQSCERDETITAKLTEIAGAYPVPPKNENKHGWVNHEGASGMWQKDVIYNNVKYRGIIMNETRAVDYSWVNMNNGYGQRTLYWFKFEPIKWRILTEDKVKKEAYLMSDIALDYQCLQPKPWRESRTVDGQIRDFNTSDGVPEGTYANNWEYCFLRQWLNETFYNEVFNDLHKELIQTVKLSNDVLSCNPNEYPTLFHDLNGTNIYANQCRDTYDKVFLVSLRDITTKAYGFSAEVTAEDPARKYAATDFARFHGLSVSVSGDEVTWFTRSPSTWYDNPGITNYGVFNGEKGKLDRAGVFAKGGVVPALWINLN